MTNLDQDPGSKLDFGESRWPAELSFSAVNHPVFALTASLSRPGQVTCRSGKRIASGAAKRDSEEYSGSTGKGIISAGRKK
jgi:hypothetical protein